MTGRPYWSIPYPRRAAVGSTSPYPARYYADLVIQGWHYGAASHSHRRRLMASAARTRIAPQLIRRLIPAAPRRRRPDVDAVLDAVAESWTTLASGSSRLVATEPPDVALALQLRAGLTLFLFADRPTPVAVAKVGGAGVEREVAALEQLEGMGVAPRYLGRAGPAQVQEGIAGRPMQHFAITPEDAVRLEPPSELQELGDAFAAIAAQTARRVAPRSRDAQLALAETHDGLSWKTRRRMAAARRDLTRLEVSALGHLDTSPQNWLSDGGGLAGIVDWELAEPRSMPGWDVWNAALSYFEHGLAQVSFRDEVVSRAFATAWPQAPLFEWSRTAARRAALAAEVDEGAVDALQLAFFATRLGNRLQSPASWSTSVETAASAVETVASG